MTIRVALNHQTHYLYDRQVMLSPQIVRLRPAPHCRTSIHAYSLKILPEQHFINWQQDPYGNFQARLVFPEKTEKFTIEVEVVAEMVVINPFDFFIEDECEHFPFKYEPKLLKELAPYLEIRDRGPLIKTRAEKIDRSRKRCVDFLVQLNQEIQKEIAYVIRLEPGIQSCEETLALKSGSCRDSAWLLVQILRHLGLAARFASGYLIQLTPDVKPLEGPAGPTNDFTDLHAWAEVFLPGAGWIGLDPTSGLFAGEGHIPLACTPDPEDAAPVTGFTEKCECDFHHAMNVQRIYETPRVTKPYTENQWEQIVKLGHEIDDQLQSMEVKLTMGGEPTFVALEETDAPEWNTTALSPRKRHMAGELLKRLRECFSPGGALHYGQGKWYPGEPLPRWALACFWRKDGLPIWNDLSLIAQENRSYGYDYHTAEGFLSLLAVNLGVNPAHILPGYEDVYYYLWREGTLPVNLDPLDHNLEDIEERARLRKLLEKGLDTITGFTLPLRWNWRKNGKAWESSPWNFRRNRMFLLPGDSPMGFRLPLKSLPWVEKDQEGWFEHNPMEQRGPLPDFQQAVTQRIMQVRPSNPQSVSSTEKDGTGPRPVAPASALPAGRSETWSEWIGTSLCVEPREGRLYVFLPPLPEVEAYLDLVACIERTASELNIPVIMEGYEPPLDWRLQHFRITPDPGVIEVNIHPSESWDELVFKTTTLYEEAHQCRLGTEKFMLDGRHTGTGGGNHVTLGGLSPLESPLLRRPDLLKSLINFWQNHPSLSYLFSGTFIGPTSQAPRVDEGRHESIYELGIAFQQVPHHQTPPPWLVDRLFRHLLVDITGNTHRTEFCIDKLYSPDSLSGRHGLLEMRAFEMPPHARMSLVQMLLLRALVADFWQRPYEQPLVNWGTELQDRFMLQHYVWEDFKDVVWHLQQHGYPLQLEWFAPFAEFRFPKYGSAQIGDLQVELRMALEPWHVLGEEATAGGTARFVDSSVERLQVKVNGMTDTRHIVTCNGRRLPLKPTGTRTQFVAGVRYRAWQPPSALHPTIPVHAPLIIDVVDSWNGRSIGGCTYHVAHPAGRNFTVFPINANEAEARRIARFWPYGHTPGPMQVINEEPNPDLPYTLDLRLQPRR